VDVSEQPPPIVPEASAEEHAPAIVPERPLARATIAALIRQMHAAEERLRSAEELLTTVMRQFREFQDGSRSVHIQIRRTVQPDNPPGQDTLRDGELCVEQAEPRRLWLGVPAEIDPAKRVLLIDATEIARLVERMRELETRVGGWHD